MYSPSDRYQHNVVNMTNPNRTYSEIDLEEVRADHKVGLCPEEVVDFVESKVEPVPIDAFDLAKELEEHWRVALLQSMSSGSMSSKDVKRIKVYIKQPTGEFTPVYGAYNHHGLGVILEI